MQGGRIYRFGALLGTGGTAPGPASVRVTSNLMTDNASFSWARINNAGRYRCFSPSFATIFGYTLDDLRTEKDWVELTFPDAEE
jgi:hypothetical protein